MQHSSPFISLITFNFRNGTSNEIRLYIKTSPFYTKFTLPPELTRTQVYPSRIYSIFKFQQQIRVYIYTAKPGLHIPNTLKPPADVVNRMYNLKRTKRHRDISWSRHTNYSPPQPHTSLVPPHFLSCPISQCQLNILS